MTKIPSFIIYATAAMLFVALAPLPYDYYQLLRVVATGVFSWGAYVAFNDDSESYLPYVLGAGALLFNPIIPVHLSREIWAVIDLVAGVFLIAHQRKL